jgi:hypothetical protein
MPLPAVAPQSYFMRDPSHLSLALYS